MSRAEARLLVSGLREPAGQELPPKGMRGGPIGPPKPARSANTKGKNEFRAELIPAERAPIVSGVVMANVSGNTIQPYASSPEIWDVMAAPQAILGENFKGFRLPDPRFTIAEYAYGMQRSLNSPYDPHADSSKGGDATIFYYRSFAFDDKCLLGSPETPSKQVLPNRGNHRTYVLKAHARIFKPEMEKIMSIPGLHVYDPMWTGPFNSAEGLLITADISPHIIDGEWYYHGSEPGFTKITLDIPRADLSEEAESAGALFRLDFISINGGQWQLALTRLTK